MQIHHSCCSCIEKSFDHLGIMSKQRLQTLCLCAFTSGFMHQAMHHSLTRTGSIGWREGKSCLHELRTARRRYMSMGLSANLTEDAPDFARKKAAKPKVFFVCESCGEPHPQWWGYCRSCKQVNTLKKFTEHTPATSPGGGAAARAVEGLVLSSTKPVNAFAEVGNLSRVSRSWMDSRVQSKPQRLSDVAKGISQINWRIPMVGATGAEVSRVLGGGLVPGCLILVGGDPGVGKSTLLLQVAGLVSMGSPSLQPAPVLYVSGEESMEQISNRADRLRIPSHELFLYAATDLEIILNAIRELSPRAVVVDSIQTIYLPEASGSAGSVVQVSNSQATLKIDNFLLVLLVNTR
ncbi:hypothetical protein O6H91_03G118500 [Diphasiastrum complanatum]|uniref:Uncharacterized protein n=1 Tax=Diphasiastrum complanatum TaxID=34168 RepID=A0ACC2EAV4_DIPCM|nr:hypothetical protein O6H91_03G118500 [Diphasiastrum complanatum]